MFVCYEFCVSFVFCVSRCFCIFGCVFWLFLLSSKLGAEIVCVLSLLLLFYPQVGV